MAERRVALVTGGNRGIGLEACRQLAQLDIRVILGARDAAKGAAAAAELKAAGLQVESRSLDVASAPSIRECMGWVRTRSAASTSSSITPVSCSRTLTTIRS